jgi:hypothetical protein
MYAYNLWDEHRADSNAATMSHILQEVIEEQEELHDEEIEWSIPPLIEINGEFFIGILKIPALSLELPVNFEMNDEALKTPLAVIRAT